MTDAVALTVKTAHDGRICVFILGGALDLTTAAEFLEHVARAVDDRTERLVLDLAGLAFLDCAGARALVMAAYAAPTGCPVIVRSVSPPAARLIDLLNLDLQHLGQDPSAGLEDYGRPARQAQPAGPTALSDHTFGEFPPTGVVYGVPARLRPFSSLDKRSVQAENPIHRFDQQSCAPAVWP